MSKYVGKIITNQAPAGYSVFFDGSGDDLSIATNTAFADLPGDFTIECWFYTGSTSVMALAGTSVFNSSGYFLELNYSGAGRVSFVPAPFGNRLETASSVYSTNTWNHIAYVRSGTTVTIYVNGTSVVSGTRSVTANTQPLTIGQAGNGWDARYYFNGYISNFRIVKGTALYTAAFTPPTQLLRITNTSILTCNSPAIVDQSSNAFAITVNGNSAVSTFTPFTAYVPYNPALGASTPGVWTLDEAMQAAATRQWNMYDPSFQNTTLLLHGNGANTAQNNTFLDSSSNNFTITRNGNTTQGSFSPFSQTGWSNFFVASASSTIGFANNAAFQFGAPSGNTNDFVIEFFVYPTTTSISVPVGTGYTSATTYWMFNLNRTVGGVNTAGYVQFYLTDNFNITATTGLITNQQNHICAVRTGTTVSLFVNGIRQATGTSSVNPNPTGSLYVGGEALFFGRYLDGYVSNLRIIKGATLPYDANALSITVPTSQLTAITGTTVLTCQSNRFVDNSSNGLSIAITGTPSVQAFSPFYPTAAYTPATIGGSGYFDGTGDYLTIASNTAFNLGTGDFTLEFFVYPTGVSQVWISRQSSASGWNNIQWWVATDASGVMTLAISDGSNGQNAFANPNVPRNAWSHVAIVRSAGVWYVYLNGVSQSLAVGTYYSASMESNTTGQPLNLGGFPGWGLTTGNLANIRLAKGVVVYTGNFTPPRAPLSTSGVASASAYSSTTNVNTSFAASATSLLTNFTNAGIVDSTAKNVLETVGNAQISTTQSKFGGSSIYMAAATANTDYLVQPASRNIEFGTGNFTVEFWMWPTSITTNWSTGNYATILDADTAAGASTTDWWIIHQLDGAVVFASNNAIVLTSSSALTASTWQHVALVRNGSGTNNLTFYVNGTSVGSATYTAAVGGNRKLFVGTQSGQTRWYKGYIDDLRVTKGIARYTANFTPQTSQWQDQ